jgi:hypothetical protein
MVLRDDGEMLGDAGSSNFRWLNGVCCGSGRQADHPCYWVNWQEDAGMGARDVGLEDCFEVLEDRMPKQLTVQGQ